eukprot:TRINITY_DN55217_c0_g1_i1.p2 TRINITY_DN55217_c0_g1~~TRINITY_DN55217_c0_g1_i1.p2  ORF type:complete len:172 (+),score=36.05 TRINITY_DN55217_c0_g1_i1:77-517(+)
MVAAACVLILALLPLSSAKPVDVHNDTLVSHLDDGKHLFVLFSNDKFDSPKGAHMDEAAAWEKLGAHYKDDETVLIGHINCYHDVADIKMCREHKITGYPTFVHYKGDEWTKPGRHQQYGGKRDFESLKQFVESYLKLPKGRSAEL